MLTWERPRINVRAVQNSVNTQPELALNVTELLMMSFKHKDETAESRDREETALKEAPLADEDGEGWMAVDAPFRAAPPAKIKKDTGATIAFRQDEDESDDAPSRDDVVPALDAYKRPVKVDRMAQWPGLLVFLVLTGLMVGFQWRFSTYSEHLTVYLWTRNILALSAFALVLADAFQCGIGYAALCIAFPPYLVVYAITRLTSYNLRGMVFAVLAAVCTEMFFIPEHSIVFAMHQGMEEFIKTVDAMIVRAGS